MKIIRSGFPIPCCPSPMGIHSRMRHVQMIATRSKLHSYAERENEEKGGAEYENAQTAATRVRQY